jgi:hypothetical protein
MALQLTYADTSPVREGDWVLIERGTALGRVSEIISSPELAAERNLEGLGVVVDAQPKDFVFLSQTCLREDPLQYVRRGPSERTRVAAAIALGVGLLIMLPALYSLLSAVYSAFSTGEVMVISVGRSEVNREMVSWSSGWARFAGPPILVASLVAFDGSRGVTLRWWFSAAGSACALALLGYSVWFTSINRTLGFIGLLVFVVLAHQVGKRFGRAAAIAFVVACAGLLIWRATGAT